MSSADLATVVIACPHCGTRYQVPYGAVGDSGRDVQCAQCGKSWHAEANQPPPPAIDPDLMFGPAEEAALDTAFEREQAAAAPPAHPAASAALDPDHERTLAEIRAAIAPRPGKRSVNSMNAAQISKARKSFDRRQRQVVGSLPLARIRRTARLAALVLLLSMLILGFALRTDLVTWFPSLAGLYASIGLPVNVVGLSFEDSKTLSSLREGKMVMQITARIRSIASRTAAVPPVRVSLLNQSGATIYEWTVTPTAPELNPGEFIDFTTEVTAPPEGVASVRLSFAAKAS